MYLFPIKIHEMHIIIQANETNRRNYYFKKARYRSNGRLFITYLPISNCIFYFTYVF